MPAKRFSILFFLFFFSLRNIATGQQPELILPVGHTEDIFQSEYIAGGKFLITFAYDNTAKLWDVYSGKLMHTFPNLLHTPEHITNSGNTTWISGDGRYLAALTTDGYLKKWELPEAKLLYKVKTGNNKITGMEYSSDGRYILLKRGWTSNEMDAEVLDAANGRPVYSFPRNKPEALSKKSIELSPDGKYILMRSDSSLWLVHAPGRSLAFKLEHLENFNAAYFSPGGKYIVVFPKHSNKLRLWRVKDAALHELQASGTVVFSPDSRYILSTEQEKMTLADAGTGRIIHSFDKQAGPRMRAQFSSDGKYIFLVRDRQFIRGTDPYDSVTHIWETESGKKLLTLRGERSDMHDVVISRDNRFIAAISGIAQLWDMATGKLIRSMEGGTAAFSDDNKNLALTGSRSVMIFNMRIGDILSELKGHSNSLAKVVFSPDGKQLIMLSNDRLARIWETGKGISPGSMEEHSIIKDAAFSKDGRNILLLTEEGRAVIRSIATGRDVLLLTEYNALAANFSPDGRQIIYSGADSTVSVMDAESGKVVFRLKERYLPAEAGISDDGRFAYYIFGGSATGVIDLNTGRVFKEYLGEENIVRCSFSPDSRYFFVLGEKGTARLFVNESGKQARQLSTASDTEYGITYLGGYYYRNLWKGNFEHFSPDGKKILYRTYMDNYVIIRDMENLSSADTVLTKNSLVTEAAIVTHTGELVTGSNDDRVRIWVKGRKGYRLSREFPGNGFQLSPDGKWLLIVNNAELQFYDLPARQLKARAVAINRNDYFIQLTEKPYYAASKGALQTLLFRFGEEYLSFEQFDLQLNRPDLVLEALQHKDKQLINAYRNAFAKRVKKYGIKAGSFGTGYTPPEADFLNRDSIGYQQETDGLTLSVRGIDKASGLDRFNCWVNEVPLFGRKGIRITKRNMRQFDTTFTIRLSAGYNRLETSVFNEKGAESYRVPLPVNFTSDIKQKESLYFIGIGIDKFSDSRYNLLYSCKDIRDLAVRFKEKSGGEIIIDTLFNENVTTSNIKSLKRTLQQTTVNDIVIISYSGHGLLSKEYDYYLSTYSVNFDKPEQNGLPYEDLENLLDSIPARKKLMLIDACHSGEVDKEEIALYKAAEDSLNKQGTKGGELRYTGKTQVGMKNSFELMQSLFVNVGKSTGATIISAAAGTQYALERGDLENGVFTYCILEAMDRYPTIKISELKKIVGERVEQLTNGLQKPTSRNESIAVDWSLW